MRFVYASWTGTRRARLDPDRVFEELSRFLSETDDLHDALDRLLRSGVEGLEVESVGVDDLLAKIRERIQELAQQYHFDRVFDAYRGRIDDLLECELEGVDAVVDDPEERERRRRVLSRVPQTVREAMDRLAHYGFRDPSAAREFASILEEREDIDRVAGFIERHGRMFRGPIALDFDDALDLIDEIEALRQIEQALFNRDFSEIDLDRAEELLGVETSRAIEALQDVMAALIEAGLVTPTGTKLALTAKGAERLGRLALREIQQDLAFDAPGEHAVERRGSLDVDAVDTRPYRFGEPLQLAPVATVSNAVRRSPGLPLSLEPSDLVVLDATHRTGNATVLLLDMSWSMSWEGRFAAAKKVALAMRVLMRSRFPRDYFAIVGFYTRAVEVDVGQLPEVTWNMGDPFTNLQDGLRLGSELLARQPGRNKNLIVITDGQPTAYYSGGRLFCEWPMSLGGLSTRATVETLREVERVTRKGVRINTFMLDDSPPLRAFVDKMTAINRGRAFYTKPSDLGHFLLVDYVRQRRKVL
jgi:uncharacterized protein with von Willebrand factor type A (vWA) domain